MSLERALQERSARVIVVGNEKGGSGKSTVAINVAVALMKSGQRVATIDLDSRQRSFSRIIENRRAWARHVGRDLDIPNHVCIAVHLHETIYGVRGDKLETGWRVAARGRQPLIAQGVPMMGI